ncbi:MAG: acetylornithine deacetylase [Myxococcota bacterium]
MEDREHLEPVVEEIRRLVGFPTVARESNLALIEDVRTRLEDLGIPCRLTFSEEGDRANLFATFGPADRPGVILSGHTDVVPVTGQAWTTDPFEVVERDGRLYGRGTADMKSFLAVPLALAEQIAAADLARPLHLALSYDEEVGCVGVRRMLPRIEEWVAPPIACIVGEPTEMQVVTGHKGKLVVRCHVRGLDGHSSRTDQGVNAVEFAAEVVSRLRRLATRLRDEGPFDAAFEPAFTTVHTGWIEGGTALNIIPASCTFELEVRNLPGHDPDALLAEVRDFAEQRLVPEMREVAPDAGIEWEERTRYPGLATPEDAPVTSLARSLTGGGGTRRVSYGSEAGLFEAAGIPSVLCGPGSIGQAHKPDEFVTLEQVAAHVRMVRHLVDRLRAE